MFPLFSRVRMNRQWGGIVDVSPDACPIISKTDVKGLYFNCGWGTGGFKATPGSGWVFAHTVANDSPHPVNAPFSLDRFYTGHLIDEHGAAAVAPYFGSLSMLLLKCPWYGERHRSEENP